jgi:hypothetical protein
LEYQFSPQNPVKHYFWILEKIYAEQLPLALSEGQKKPAFRRVLFA